MAHIHQRVYPNGRKGKWQAVVRHPSGKRLHKSDPLRRVVAEWAAEQEAKIRRGEWLDPTGGKVTLERWWAQWSAPRADTVELATNARNESQWRNHVKPAFGTWPIGAITSWEVEAWVARMVKAGVGGETVASSLRLLRQLLAAAVRFRLLPANAADLVSAPAPPKHVDRFLTRDEADRLLSELDGQDRLFVDLLLNTGLRWSEAAGLHCFRVDLMRGRLMVVETIRRDQSVKDKPKSPAGQRQVSLTPRLIAGLSAHMAGRPREGYVFTNSDGKPLAYTNWRRRVWVPAVERADLATPLPTPHDARHTYGSWLAERGLSAPDIAALMGHSSTRATDRYLHAAESRFVRSVDALDAGDSVKAVGPRSASPKRS